MKRIFAMLLCLCLLLCGCNKAEPVPTTEPTTEPTTAPTTEPTTAPTTEPPVLYRNPINGQPLEAPYKGRIVTAVLGNTKDARPQYSISNADIIFELETEGGITRLLAVYSDVANAGVIGPIRSARTFFNSITKSFDGVIAHCGGSERGIAGYADISGGKISNWEHLTDSGSYFYRDQDRLSRGVAREHTLFTTGEKYMAYMGSKDYSTANEIADMGMTFSEDVVLNGETANNIVISFRNNWKAKFIYDAQTGLYAAEQDGSPRIDGNTNEQVSFKNVMVLYTPQTFQRDRYYSRSYYQLVGEGEGNMAVNGQMVKIKWSRPALESPFTYSLEDGTPLTFGVGNTYIAVACTSSDPVELS